MYKKESFSTTDCLFLGKPLNASLTEEQEEEPLIKKPIDYKKETIFYFYNAMLNSIVDEWQVNIDDTNESIASGDKIINSKPYESYTDGVTIEEEEEEVICDTMSTSSHRKPTIKPSSHMNINGKEKYESRQNIALVKLSTSDVFIKKHRKSIQRKSFSKFKPKKSRSKVLSLKKVSKLNTLEKFIEKEDPMKDDDWILKSEKEMAIIKFTNGDRYTGELYEKIMHGTGQYMWRNGTTYTGDFKHGMLTGKGRFEFSDKCVYEGEVYKGYIHGHGNEYLSDNDCLYNGQFHLGTKHGTGRMIFGKNNYYDGPWNMDKREGKGLRHYENGTKYYGDWVNGKRNGFGVAILKNKDFYHGEWINGQKQGYGEYVWDAFLNNYLCIPVQNKYCGIWNQDYMHGFGLLYMGVEGGARYAGTFYKNIKHGAGIVVCNNGKVIKSDPLFVNDKAIRFKVVTNKKQPSSIHISFIDDENSENTQSVNNSCTDLTCVNLEPRIFPIMPHHVRKQQRFTDIGKFIFPCYGFEKSTIAKINQYELIYPDLNIECVSLSIDLSSSELIDLSKIINKVAAKHLYVMNNTNNKENMSNIKKRYFSDFKVWPCLLSEHFCEDYVFNRFNKYKECDNFFVMEEDRTRKALSKNLNYLMDLYNYYACVACVQTKPNYKPWLMRICLWQLFMDCKMHYKNISCDQIDDILAEYSTVQVANIHNPFDVIYFWEFLTLFLALAWQLYGNDFITIKSNGILEKAFNKLLTTDIMPNAKRHKGVALFEYRDVVPITAAYEWYKSFGPNFTVYDFLKSSSSLYRKFPPEYYQDVCVTIPKIQNGENVAFISNKILFRKVESYILAHKKYTYPVVPALQHGFYLKSLKYLFLLGSRRVLNILTDICPMVVIENEYINMNHVLSFLEFYEAVLRCTQEKIIEDAKVQADPPDKMVGNRKTIFELPRVKPHKPYIRDTKKMSRTKTL